MSSIEIHGMEKELAEKERENIFELFKEEEYVRDIVVTIFSTDVRDRRHRKLPFIRLIGSDHLKEATVLLLELGLDLEILELKKFIGGGKRNEKFK